MLETPTPKMTCPVARVDQIVDFLDDSMISSPQEADTEGR